MDPSTIAMLHSYITGQNNWQRGAGFNPNQPLMPQGPNPYAAQNFLPPGVTGPMPSPFDPRFGTTPTPFDPRNPTPNPAPEGSPQLFGPSAPGRQDLLGRLILNRS